MRLKIHAKKKYIKAVKKLTRSGRVDLVAKTKEAVQLLSVNNAPARFFLREQWDDHPLKGDKNGIRELHLNEDMLMIYKVHEKAGYVELINIVSHEELRKKI